MRFDDWQTLALFAQALAGFGFLAMSITWILTYMINKALSLSNKQSRIKYIFPLIIALILTMLVLAEIIDTSTYVGAFICYFVVALLFLIAAIVLKTITPSKK